MKDSSMKFMISPTESLNKAWHAVTTNLGPILGFIVLFYVASAVAGMIPFLGRFTNLFQFIFTVSLFSAFDSIERNGKASFNDLFSWSPKFGKLLAAYLIIIAIAVVLFLPVLIFLFSMLGADVFSMFSSGGSRFVFSQISGASVGIFVGILLLAFVAGILLAVFTFAFMFIVQFREMPLMDALKLSIRIGRENFGQIIVYALLSLGVALLGLLALVLGLLVAIPLIVGMQYYMLRSVLPAAEVSEWDFMKGGAPRT